jgi:hypothetical protein
MSDVLRGYIEPSARDVMATVGGEFVLAVTVMVAGALVTVCPKSSVVFLIFRSIGTSVLRRGSQMLDRARCWLTTA